jgi:hypothetical protein
MKCTKCGEELPDNSNFCNNCGKKMNFDSSQKNAIVENIQVFFQPVLKYLAVVSFLVGVILMTNESRFDKDYVNIIDSFANAFITTGLLGIVFKLADDSKLIKDVVENSSKIYINQMRKELKNHLEELDTVHETSSAGIITTSINKCTNECAKKMDLITTNIKTCTKECSEKMNKRYELLREIDNVGLEHIFYRTTAANELGLDLLFSSIKEQIDSKTGTVYIVGIAALEVFPISERGNRYEKLLEEYLEDKNNKCQVRVLLLNPDSSAAKLKAKLEYPHDTINHIRGTIDKINKYQIKYPTTTKLNYKLYKSMPIALIFMTSNRLFLEPYPNVNINKPNQDLIGPIGGKTPLIVIKKDYEAYHRWKAHVEHLWDYNSEEYPGINIETPDHIKKEKIPLKAVRSKQQ